MHTKPFKILLGPSSDDSTESVSQVNKSLAEGLDRQYRVIFANSNRKYGNTRLSKFNFWNIYYVAKHAICWFFAIILYRPHIAHYAVSSGPALAKGLLMLSTARLLGVQTIAHLHSGDFLDFWNKLSPRHKSRALKELNRLDAFIVLSEKWKRDVTEVVDIPNEKFRVVNNPISKCFQAAALKMPVDRSKNIFFGLGLMGKDKGILELVAAAELTHQAGYDFEILLAGPEREPGIWARVENEIKTRKLESHFKLHGSIWGEEKLKYYRESSIFLLPSYFENFPLVALEAAAAGQAIITTPVGAIPEFFDHNESALFVESGNAIDLSDAMIRLLKDPQEREDLAKGARNVFTKKLAREEIIKTLESIYNDVLKTRI